MTVLAQQFVSVAMEADSVFFQLYSGCVVARNSTMEFLPSVVALTAARIIGREDDIKPAVQHMQNDGVQRRCLSQ